MPKNQNFLWNWLVKGLAGGLLLILFIILGLAFSPEGFSAPPLVEPTPWVPVVPGIDYREFSLPDPNHVYVARMDRSYPELTLESSLSQGRLSGGFETVSGMAARYDGALNYWGEQWGGRNKVVVAINGSFYDKDTGVPQRGVIHSGWMAKRFDLLENGSGFVWKLDRSAFIGQCVTYIPRKQIVTYLPTGNTQRIDGVNVPRGDNDFIIYTPQYDADTQTDNGGVEVLVEMTRPAMLLGPPGMATGFVRAIYNGSGSTPIPFDHVVLSASGGEAATLLANVNLGEEVGISQEVRHFEDDCETVRPVSWQKAYASVGGSFNFLKDGVIQTFTDVGANTRLPRTAIAFNDAYIFFIVVDGRNPNYSVGMTMQELGIFARDTLSATWGINQDGGGSSTMVVSGEVKNNTFCNNLTCRSTIYLPLVVQSNPVSQTFESRSEPEPSLPSEGAPFTLPGGEALSTSTIRAVANGMMMVVVEPISRTTTFTVTEPVVTLETTAIRLGPGTNYAVSGTVPAGSGGTILAHMNNLNGVFATGSYWWKVEVLGKVGWVREESLQSQSPLAVFSRLGWGILRYLDQ